MSTTTVRNITVKSSQGRDNFTFQFAGETLAELKTILKKEGYNVDSMKIIESVNRTTLEHPTAKIPTVDFRLHLYPKATKGGGKKAVKEAVPRSQLYAKIKVALGSNKDKADKLFNEGQNFTRKKTEILNELVAKWEKKHGVIIISVDPVLDTFEAESKVGDTPKKARATAKAVAGIVDDLHANATKEELAKAEKSTPAVTIKTSIQILKGISDHENQVLIEEAITKLEKALIVKPTLSEQELATKEHQELLAGLEGVSRY